MKVILNGEPQMVDDGTRVDDLLVLLGRDRQGLGLAIAVNGDVVPRAEWGDYEINDKDRVEVLQAIGGG